MKRLLLSLALCVIAIPAFAQQNNIGSCGWGSKLFQGQRGIFPQVLAVTTNGTSGNQTFGISSGTSGCTQDGLVTSSWKNAMFIDNNMNKLARDMSQGNGESLTALATLMGVRSEDRATFFAQTQAHFGAIFPNAEVTAIEVAQNLNSVLKADAQLSRYAQA